MQRITDLKNCSGKNNIQTVFLNFANFRGKSHTYKNPVWKMWYFNNQLQRKALILLISCKTMH